MVESFYAAITDSTVFNLVSHVEVADMASESWFFRRVWLDRGVTVTDDNSEDEDRKIKSR